MQKHVIEKIKNALDTGTISTDPEDLICSSYDVTRKTGNANPAVNGRRGGFLAV
jgi:hypothetical protein